MQIMTRTLIFGGARSGKSAHAEAVAAASGKTVIYVATAQAFDSEMKNRIRQHRLNRNSDWQTIEEPLELGSVIARESAPDRVLLIDCLTVWLSNLLFSEEKEYPEVGEIVPPELFHVQRGHFLQALEQAAGDVIMVSNEVGMGVIPQGAISRWFVDEAGRLNQAVAATSERVLWVAAGLPLALKGASC
jgi:adenosylcobinamide kinase/adenosylcobinamide-phosphate guanylyltransferase